MYKDLQEIYLEPEGCAADPDIGRQWCEDNICCDGCESCDYEGRSWEKYIRADVVAAKDETIKQLREAICIYQREMMGDYDFDDDDDAVESFCILYNEENYKAGRGE